MTYVVNELFFSIQGEGAQVGRPAIFCRFAGCNLWSGREEDRARAACTFCDTDFVGSGPDGGRFDSAEALANALALRWPAGADDHPFVVLTGGEPSLQVDQALLDALHARGCEVAIETNGTRALPRGLDWICVSPKAGIAFVVRSGDELKVVFPQRGMDLESLLGLDFKHRFLQPMDGPAAHANTRLAVDYCLRHPAWRLSLQTHKLLGVR